MQQRNTCIDGMRLAGKLLQHGLCLLPILRLSQDLPLQGDDGICAKNNRILLPFGNRLCLSLCQLLHQLCRI